MLLGITPTYCPEVLSYKRGQTLSSEIFKRILNRYQDPVLWTGRGLNFFPVLTTHSVQVSVVSVTFCFFLSFHLQMSNTRKFETLNHCNMSADSILDQPSRRIAKEPQPDSCWSWVVCLARALTNIIICGVVFSYGIMFPTLLEEFQQGKATTGDA